MMFPSYVDVYFDKEREFSSGRKAYNFTLLIQGYKTKVGFKICKYTSVMNDDKQIPQQYDFKRYGWSSGMLLWRNEEFKNKTYYLENFLMKSDIEKIESFLVKDRRVLVEKAYKWPVVEGRHLIIFKR